MKKGGGLRVWKGIIDKWQEPGRVWEEEKGRSRSGRGKKGARVQEEEKKESDRDRFRGKELPRSSHGFV